MSAPVLIVDDEEIVRRTLSACLGKAGYAVAEAASGDEALAQIAGGLRPALVILDLRMPVMDGNELIQRLIASEAYTAPRVLLTAYVDDLRQDLVGHLKAIREKPIRCAELVQVVRETIGDPPPKG